MEPQLAVSAPQTTLLMDHFNLVAQASTITATTPFGTSATVLSPTSNSTLGGTLQGSTDKYTFPPSLSSGTFMMVYTVYFASPGADYMDVGSVVNMSAVNLIINNTTQQAWGASTSVNYSTSVFFYKITGAGASFTILGNGAGSSATGADWYVTQIPSTIN